MKISGFTIIKDAIINDYPIVEAITSILPVVDEMIVLIGQSSDDTEELIRNINSIKIKIHHSVWDATLRKGGQVLAVETNKAFALIDKESDWAFYIQADEVLHEKYHDEIIKTCFRYLNHSHIDGLLFKYLHFYGSYDIAGNSRRWYNHEVRIIRNNQSITSFRDAQGFRRGGKKLKVKDIDAYIYHYGWVKNPKKMKIKMKQVSQYWRNDVPVLQDILSSNELFNFNEFDSLQKFSGTHPVTMLNRIALQDWQVNLDTRKKKFNLKDRLLFYFEKLTGKRVFSFTNYKRISTD